MPISDAIPTMPIERVRDLSQHEFLARVRARTPVVVEGGAADTVACRSWSLQSLGERVGGAVVNVNLYGDDPSDYFKVKRERMTLAAFIDRLSARAFPSTAYLFNDPSCVFARNASRPELHVGWGAVLNEGLTPLAADLPVPPFLLAEDFAFAILSIGTAENSTRLHFDWGGPAKALIQVSGRKRVVLFAPSSAGALSLYSMFAAGGPGNITTSRADLRAPDFEAHPRLRELVGHEAVLEPGDVIYWPSFWLHDVTNLGPDANVSVGLSLAEIRMHPLLMRQVAGEAFRALCALLGAGDSESVRATVGDGVAQHALAVREGDNVEVVFRGERTTLRELFERYERHVLAPGASERRTLLEWNQW